MANCKKRIEIWNLKKPSDQVVSILHNQRLLLLHPILARVGVLGLSSQQMFWFLQFVVCRGHINVEFAKRVHAYASHADRSGTTTNTIIQEAKTNLIFRNPNKPPLPASPNSGGSCPAWPAWNRTPCRSSRAGTGWCSAAETWPPAARRSPAAPSRFRSSQEASTLFRSSSEFESSREKMLLCKSKV